MYCTTPQYPEADNVTIRSAILPCSDTIPWVPDPRGKLFLNAKPSPLFATQGRPQPLNFSPYIINMSHQSVNTPVIVDKTHFKDYKCELVKPYNGVFIIYSDRCMFCRQVMPTIHAFAAKAKGQFTVVEYNIDTAIQHEFIAYTLKHINYTYQGVPDIFQIKNGKIIPPKFVFNRNLVDDYFKLAAQ